MKATRWIFMTLILLGSLGMVGCGEKNKVIKKVEFEVAENLESVRVALVFDKGIHTDLSAGFPLFQYGYLFANPWTEEQPFEVGFELQTAVFNEQDYIGLTPTTVLPNGVPLGIPHAVVEVRGNEPVHPKFDLVGYVDILHQSWLGMAAEFSFIDSDNFPVGVALSQILLENDEGGPAVIGHAYGPTENKEHPGGVAILADVRYLIERYADGKKHKLKIKNDRFEIVGPKAEMYRKNPALLLEFQDKMVRAFNQN